MEKKDRIMRAMELRLKPEENYIAEGYASTFTPYVLFEIGDDKYTEVIDRNAFDNADFSDCVVRVDHEGTVYARASAGNLQYSVDDMGLHVTIDLSKTASGRDLYDSIKAGNYTKMSFAFRANAENWTDTVDIVGEKEKYTHSRRVLSIDKVFDVSVVTWPANPATSIDARCKAFMDGVNQRRKQAAERQASLAKLKLKLKLLEV